MPMDRILNGGEVDRMLQHAKEQQQAQAQAQAQLQAVLEFTLKQPQKLTVLQLALVRVREEGQVKVLMISLPTGERIDVPLSRNDKVVAEVEQELREAA